MSYLPQQLQHQSKKSLISIQSIKTLLKTKINNRKYPLLIEEFRLSAKLTTIVPRWQVCYA
jgi:hypothetical protein